MAVSELMLTSGIIVFVSRVMYNEWPESVLCEIMDVVLYIE